MNVAFVEGKVWEETVRHVRSQVGGQMESVMTETTTVHAAGTTVIVAEQRIRACSSANDKCALHVSAEN